MEESVIWIFLYSVLHVFPLFSLRHVTMMDRLSIPFWKLMLYATILMIVQGTTYIGLVEVYDAGVYEFAWHPTVFVIPYVIVTLKHGLWTFLWWESLWQYGMYLI